MCAVSFITINSGFLLYCYCTGICSFEKRFPLILPSVQVDQGAIKFILNGSDIMCPGLTSKGGILPDALTPGTVIQIRCENKNHAIAIGVLTMSSDDIRKKNKGVCIEMLHTLNDGLYKFIQN
jgi:PUA domain protein